MQYLGRMTERPRNGNGHFLQKSESLHSKVNGEGLPVIHIPGKERILACLSEQLQVKKGERYPNISPSVSSRAEVRSLQTSEQFPSCVSSMSSGQRISPSDLDMRFPFTACVWNRGMCSEKPLFVLISLIIFRSTRSLFSEELRATCCS